MKAFRYILATALVLAVGACGGESGPVGPGDFQGIVDVGSLGVGAIILEVQGSALGSVHGVGNTRALAEDAVSDSKRIVLVTDQGGELRFTVGVADRSLSRPQATVVDAIGLDNLSIPDLAGISIRFEVE